MARRLAILKAAEVAGRAATTDVVLAGDTVVALDGVPLGKPRDRDDARAMLVSLSGRTHEVHSAVAVAAGGESNSLVSTTAVTFTPLSPATIDWYLDTGEWDGKAGAYAVQGAAAAFVTDMAGLDTTVVGLALQPTLALLADVLAATA